METELNRARTHSAKMRQVVSVMTTGLEEEQHKNRETLKKLGEEIKDLHELLMAKVEDGKKALETRVQEIETTIKQLKESIENSVKEVVVEKTELLGKVCDQMDEDLRFLKEGFEKMSEEHKELDEKSSDFNDNAVSNETVCCEEGIPLISQQEEIVVVEDRIPNALERDDALLSLDRQENVSFLDRATSPVKLMQSKFEGKFAVGVFLGTICLPSTEELF